MHKVMWRQCLCPGSRSGGVGFCARGRMASVFVPGVGWRQYLCPRSYDFGHKYWRHLTLGTGAGVIWPWAQGLASSGLGLGHGYWRHLTLCFTPPPPKPSFSPPFFFNPQILVSLPTFLYLHSLFHLASSYTFRVFSSFFFLVLSFTFCTPEG